MREDIPGRARAPARTGSAVAQVARGSNWSIIGGKRFTWQARDDGGCQHAA